MQLTPFPINPVLHVQENDPLLFKQSAFTWQLSVLRLHSSTSVKLERQMRISFETNHCQTFYGSEVLAVRHLHRCQTPIHNYNTWLL